MQGRQKGSVGAGIGTILFDGAALADVASKARLGVVQSVGKDTQGKFYTLDNGTVLRSVDGVVAGHAALVRALTGAPAPKPERKRKGK